MTDPYRENIDISVTDYMAKKDAYSGVALRLFRSCKDTLEIAKIMNITEADAHKRVHEAMSHEKRKKTRFVPYGELA